MGYYTSYELSLANIASEAEEEKIINELQEKSSETFDGGDSEYYVYAKWYSLKEDILDISIRFPHVFFFIEGKGEESDDFWRMYIQNGKLQFTRGRIVFEDYDPSKMVKNS